ncbi:MAG: hypothetical protein RSH52_36890, partial [Janthinobacterium sp.]
VVENTFNAGTKFESVRLENKKMQYLYNDGTDFNFMDNTSFEQIAIPADAVARAIAYAIEQPADVDINEIVLRPTAQAF